MKSKYAKLSKKHWWDMTGEERERELKELDKPLNPGQLKPLSRKQRLIWERMRASKPDVSIFVRANRRDIVIHLDEDLLAQARQYAKRNKTSLPKMIDRGLRGLLAFAG